MSEQKPSVSLILASLLMLFVKWRLDSCIYHAFDAQSRVRSSMLITVTGANICFLVTLLAAMLLYSDIGAKENLKKAMVLAFLSESLRSSYLLFCSLLPFS